MRRFVEQNTLLRVLVAALMAAMALMVSAKQFTVVIDAGHGGKDYGARGKQLNEKTVNLNVALKLGELIADEMKDVKVVYTRSDDRFLTLQQRADKANKADGDLFISIHTNSVDKSSKNRTTINGASTYTLGMHKTEENLAVAKRENSVMKLEDDFLDAVVGVLQHILRLKDDERVDPVRSRAAADLLDEFRKVFRGQSKPVGVEGHVALRCVMLGHECHEMLEDQFHSGVDRRS